MYIYLGRYLLKLKEIKIYIDTKTNYEKFVKEFFLNFFNVKEIIFYQCIYKMYLLQNERFKKKKVSYRLTCLLTALQTYGQSDSQRSSAPKNGDLDVRYTLYTARFGEMLSRKTKTENIQPNQINTAVIFWYLVKSDLCRLI